MFLTFLDFICDLMDFSRSSNDSSRLGDAPIDRQRRRGQKQMLALICLLLLIIAALVLFLTGCYPSWQQMQTFMDFSGDNMLRNFPSTPPR